MLANSRKSLFIPCLDTEEAQNSEAENCESEACVSQNGEREICKDTLNIPLTGNGKIDAVFQNGSRCKGVELKDTTSSTNVVCTSGWSEVLSNKTQIFNGETKKASQRRKSIKRMHANLSGTKYAVGICITKIY